MNVMSYKGWSARVEFDDEDGVFVGRIAGIADNVSFHGASVDELRAAFHEAVDDYLAVCAKIGKEPHKSYSGKLMLRVDPAVHAKVALAAESSGKSLSQWSEEALDMAARRASA